MDNLLNSTTTYMDLIFSQLFSKFIVAVVILLIGFVIARIIGKLVTKLLHEIELNKVLKKAGIKFNLEDILSHIAVYFIYFLTIIWSLNALGLTTTILNMISGAFLILILISILLAIKDFVPNMISGFFIYQRNIISQGDKVKLGNIEGTVNKISLVETEIKTKSGDIIHIPNSTITKKEIVVKKK